MSPQEENELNYKYIFEAWKQSIEVQQHFNDICMRIRNYFITIISALFAFMGVVLSELDDPFFQVLTISVHTSVPLLLAIIAATYLFYFIDRHWYHRLLLGAVQNAIQIEQGLKKSIPGIELTGAIGEKSPLDVSQKGVGNFFLYRIARIFGSDPRVKSEKKIHSDAKISMFYKMVGAFFSLILIVTLAAGGIKTSGPGAEGIESSIRNEQQQDR